MISFPGSGSHSLHVEYLIFHRITLPFNQMDRKLKTKEDEILSATISCCFSLSVVYFG